MDSYVIPESALRLDQTNNKHKTDSRFVHNLSNAAVLK
jgi:hypothetical protein